MATPAISSGYESPDHGKSGLGGSPKVTPPTMPAGPQQIEPRPSGKSRRLGPPPPPR